jgi:uncharacterized phage-associated protein
MHDSRTVANEFLHLAEERGAGLTPTQLLKLVYIAHGWSLGTGSGPLIRDEVQAWQFGPVIPRLYNAVRKFRADFVRGPLPTGDDTPLNEAEKDLIQQVYDAYGKRSAAALSRLTHIAGTPWAETYEPGTFGLEINNNLIQSHYERLARASGT